MIKNPSSGWANSINANEPIADSQTSERERLALLCEQSVHFYPVAAQLRADEAEISQLNRLVELRSNEAVDNLDEAIRLRDELAALRAENEALRTVTDDSIELALDGYYANTNKYHGFRGDETRSGFRSNMRRAIEAFIRSKESRRG